MKRAGWAFVLLLVFSPALHAFDVTVGRSFKITGVTRRGERVVLPQERNYANVRILDSRTYRALSVCAQSCELEGEDLSPVVTQVRPARTRTNLWIAEVDFVPSWRLTFLVIKKGKIWDVQFPAHVTFLDAAVKERTRELILQAVLQEET